MHARLEHGTVRLLTRTGLDWTHKYPAITEALTAVPASQAYLDGELCGVRPDGTTSFDMIQAASEPGNAGALVFFAARPTRRGGPLPAPRKHRHRRPAPWRSARPTGSRRARPAGRSRTPATARSL